MIKCLLNSSIRKMSMNSEKGVELKKITSFLESFAPTCLAEVWDNTGLLVEPTYPKLIKNVLLTNDLTEDVVTEALVVNAGLIISYHPPIFKPLIKITTNSWKERIIGACLENKIAIYSPHTSWDSVPGGVNDWLAGAFGKFLNLINTRTTGPVKMTDSEVVKPIQENTESLIPNSGAGRYCKLKNPMKLSEAVEKVKILTSLKCLNVAVVKNGSLDTEICDIAICAGSGSSVLANVKADLYLTGEMSHHSLLDAVHNGTSVILCNHSNSERGFLKEFMVILEKEFVSSDVKIFVSKADRDPLQSV